MGASIHKYTRVWKPHAAVPFMCLEVRWMLLVCLPIGAHQVCIDISQNWEGGLESTQYIDLCVGNMYMYVEYVHNWTYDNGHLRTHHRWISYMYMMSSQNGRRGYCAKNCTYSWSCWDGQKVTLVLYTIFQYSEQALITSCPHWLDFFDQLFGAIKLSSIKCLHLP